MSQRRSNIQKAGAVSRLRWKAMLGTNGWMSCGCCIVLVSYDRHSWHACSAPDDRHDAASFLRIHRRWHQWRCERLGAVRYTTFTVIVLQRPSHTMSRDIYLPIMEIVIR